MLTLKLGWVLRTATMLVLVALAGRQCAVAAEPPSVIVVFDGSGSMWGTLEATRLAKLTIARDALRRALSRIGPQTQVGLAGFGHRRGDCNDVEIMLPPAPLDIERVMGPLGSYNPRGRGPLTLALHEAGKALVGRQGRRSLVLVHDDADNCRPDLCALAAELKAAGITVHVVGLGVRAADVPKMACLTQITGGKSYNAATGEQVSAALEEALELASADAPRAEARSAAAPVSGGDVAAVRADAPAGLYLRAALGPKSEPVTWPLHWTVSAEEAPHTVLFDARSANPMVAAGPGRYLVEVRDGAVAVHQIVEVGENAPTVAILVLNAGTVQVKAQMTRTGAPAHDAAIAIAAAGSGDDNRKEAPIGPPLAFFRGSEGTAILPQGRYIVHVEEGLVRSERSIIVPAGSQGRIEVLLNGARVIVTAAMHDGIAADEAVHDAVFSVVEEDPDAPKGRRELARSAQRQAEFMLAPGTYYLIARQGGVEARERIAVGPGDVVRRTLVLTPGRLVLSTRSSAATPTPNEPVMYRVERIDGVPADIVTTSRPAPVLLLAGGRYRVEGRYGVMNVRTIRDVEVRAGQTQQLVLEQQAATLKLRLVANGGAQGDVFWDVRDEAGRNVWTTGVTEPSATLQAGRYAVRAETRERRYDRQIELHAGEVGLVEITAD
jgi:Ca-activated chloride channel family protein